MEDAPEVTAMKLHNEEFLYEARQENDLLYKRKLNLEFDSRIIELETKAQLEHMLNKASIIKEYGLESPMLDTLDLILKRHMDSIAKHKAQRHIH